MALKLTKLLQHEVNKNWKSIFFRSRKGPVKLRLPIFFFRKKCHCPILVPIVDTYFFFARVNDGWQFVELTKFSLVLFCVSLNFRQKCSHNFTFICLFIIETWKVENFYVSVAKFVPLIMQNSLTVASEICSLFQIVTFFSLHLACCFPSCVWISRCPIGQRACAIWELITNETICE